MRNVLDKHCRENQIHILCSITFSENPCRFWDNIGKYGAAGQAIDDIILSKKDTICMLDNEGCKHTLRICNIYRSPWAWATLMMQTILGVTLYVQRLSCYYLIHILLQDGLRHRSFSKYVTHYHHA
jgi:hypothetical protein